MSKKHLFNIVNTTIERLDSKGKGIGSFIVEGSPKFYKVMVHAAAPGDVLSVKLFATKKSDYLGEIQEVLHPGKDRTVAKCKHVPYCGGCSYQQIDYTSQKAWKEDFIQNLFQEFIREHNPTVSPLLGCEDPWLYRNKMEFTFSQNKEGEKFLGLIMTGSRGKVFNLTECFLCPKWFTETLEAVRQFWMRSNIDAYHMLKDTGSLRTLTLRQGIKTGDRMVLLTVSGNPDYKLTAEQIIEFKKALQNSMDEETWEKTSVFLQIHQIQKGTPSQFYEMLLHGPDHIKEELTLNVQEVSKTLHFKISPTSFFQPNTKQAEKLYQRVLEILGPVDRAFDLYCGTGTLSLLLSSIAKQVVAVELNPHAVFDAEVNKELNEIDNVQFIKGDVGKVLEDLLAQDGFIPPDAVIVDPPRAGLDPKAITHVLKLNPSKILYVSCNPKTQADNIKDFVAAGYRLMYIQPVDQFPHTMHLENIVLLSKDS